MAAQNPPVNGVAYTIYIALQDMANPGSYKANPTLAAGDAQVSIDGGAFANLGTLPAVAPAAGVGVRVVLSAAEMTGDNILVKLIDQTNPKEWADYAFTVQTVAAVWPTAAALVTAQADLDDIQLRLPTALIGGRMDSSVGAMAAAVLTATAIQGGAITSGKFAAGAVNAAAIADGAIDALTFAAGAIDAAALATDAVTEIQNGLATAASIAALNNLSSAQAQTAAAAALTAYDPPTSAELVSEINAVQADIAALSIPTANANADALLDRADAVEVGLTPRGALRLQAAALAGELSGAATATVTIRNAVADSKDRIVATVDASGNRTAVTTDVS